MASHCMEGGTCEGGATQPGYEARPQHIMLA